jgi:hypothetical protein
MPKPIGLKRIKKPEPTDFERWSLEVADDILRGATHLLEPWKTERVAAIIRQRVREKLDVLRATEWAEETR